MLCLTIVMAFPSRESLPPGTCAPAPPGANTMVSRRPIVNLCRRTRPRVRKRHAQAYRRPQRPPQGPGDRGAGRVRHGVAQDGGGDGFRRPLHDRVRNGRLPSRASRRGPRELRRDGRTGRSHGPDGRDAADRRRRYGLRRALERAPRRSRLRAGGRGGDPARGPGVPQEMRPHARPAGRPGR